MGFSTSKFRDYANPFVEHLGEAIGYRTIDGTI